MLRHNSTFIDKVVEHLYRDYVQPSVAQSEFDFVGGSTIQLRTVLHVREYIGRKPWMIFACHSILHDWLRQRRSKAVAKVSNVPPILYVHHWDRLMWAVKPASHALPAANGDSKKIRARRPK
jgi:hypothetical protein